MSNNNDLRDALVALGLVAAGTAGVVALSMAADKRKAFRAALSSSLSEHSLALINSELIKRSSGPEWKVTIRHPRTGVQSLVAAFENGTDPYSVGTASALATRIANAVWSVHA